jgi:hypothetical protein
MGVEAAQRDPHDEREGALDVELLPRPAVQVGVGEVADDRPLDLLAGDGERRRAAAPLGLLVEPAGHQAPRLRVIGHVVVDVAVEFTGGVLLVDEVDQRDARLGVLGGELVGERGQGGRLGR